jgi:DNA-binding CsgD family transcriptional regulator
MSFQSKLSKREFEVLELVSSGSSNSQVAEMLGISRSTAKTHLRNIYTKTDYHNRTVLAISFLNSKA